MCWVDKRNIEGWITALPRSGLRISAVYLCLLLVQLLQTTTISLSPQEEQGRQMRDEEPGREDGWRREGRNDGD